MGVEGQIGDGCNIAPIPLWGQVSGNHLFFLRLYTQWAFSKWRFKAFLDLFYWERTPKRPHESAMASMAKQHRQRGIHVSTDFHQGFQGRKSEVKTSPALVSSKASPLGLLPCALRHPSLHVCVPVDSSYKDTHHIGLGQPDNLLFIYSSFQKTC